MASKVWKKLLFIILVIACLFNITLKLVQRSSFKDELQSSAQYVQDLKQEYVQDLKQENNQVQENVTVQDGTITSQNEISIMNIIS